MLSADTPYYLSLRFNHELDILPKHKSYYGILVAEIITPIFPT